LAQSAWTLDWDLDGLDLETSGAWSVETDLGFEVRIDQGALFSYALSLAPCTVSSRTLQPSLVATAWAGHGEVDPAQQVVALVESLTLPNASDIAPISFPASEYCGVHWLVAHGEITPDAPQSSLQVHGIWARGEQGGNIGIDTQFAHALLTDFGPTSGSGRRAEITLVRPLESMFDGIDFTHQSDDVLAWAALENLTAQARVQVTLD
jgi:hypothetical protein